MTDYVFKYKIDLEVLHQFIGNVFIIHPLSNLYKKTSGISWFYILKCNDMLIFIFPTSTN